jgi:predicted O-methyltransferase YrrM
MSSSTQEQWTAVDQYYSKLLMEPDSALDAALADSNAANLPSINVAPNQGKLLHLLAKTHGCQRILEVGTLGGYSTIWLARALPTGGKLITLEYEPRHAEVAKKNIARAGLSDAVEIRVGRAIDSLPKLAGAEPFDLVFIDADKTSTADYFAWSLKLTRPGSMIIVDNVVRKGAVVDPKGDDAVQGIRRFNELLSKEKRVEATAIQTVGTKGYDGFVIARVK